MKKTTHTHLFTLAASFSLAVAAQGAVLYTADFTDGLNPFNGGSVSGGQYSTADQYNAQVVTPNPGVPGGDVITLEFDVTYQADGSPNFYGGLENDTSRTNFVPGQIGIQNSDWRLRDFTGASTLVAHGLTTGGTNRTDRFRLVYDFTAGTMAASFDDGADGSGWAAITTINTNFTGDESNVTGVYLRGGSGTAVFDNLLVFDNTVVPEPASGTLLLLAGAFLMRRRR
ncbi:MAG: PEP-CTERM sorting domain-containing protein [Akkermansiaceae bacterium]|nr:PEP-CTERM sorting domain-containing protein [Akkermansiaceae bacterium]